MEGIDPKQSGSPSDAAVCRSCGRPIHGTSGAVRTTNHHGIDYNSHNSRPTTTYDPGPYHYPECMPPIVWCHK